MNESIGEWVDISALEPWKDNPRQNQSAIDEVAKSIKRFGFASPIIARAADKMIIAGHTRFEAAKKIGLKSVPVRFMDLDLNDAQLLALADNKIGEIADWDEDKLKDILASLDDQDLSGLGWSDEELDALIDQDDPVELNGDPDDVPEVEEQAITSAGDLWLLGDHRLLCGDSTKEEDVERLMAGEKADICFTSPPYALGKSIKLSGNKHFKDKETPYLNHKDDSKSWINLMDDFFETSKRFVKFGHFINIQMLADNKRDLIAWIHKHSKRLCDILIWDKGHVQPSMASNVMNSSFEFLIIFGQDESSRAIPCANWRGTIKNVYSGQNQRDNQFSDLHAATMPIHLPNFVLNDLANDSKSIFEPFGGTGTTLISCEKAGRKSYHMEIDPKYCDVIIRRWQELTGKEAIKEDGIKFNDIADIPW